MQLAYTIAYDLMTLSWLPFGWILLGASFLLPGHYPPWTSFEQQALAALGSAVIALSVWWRYREGGMLIPRLAWLALGLAGVAALQKLLGQIHYLSDAVLVAGYLVAFATMVMVGAAGADAERKKLIDGLGTTLMVAAIVSTGLAAAQWLGQWSSIWVTDLMPGNRPFANLAQPNHLSTLLALATMATLQRFEDRRFGGIAAAVVIAWFGFGLVMTQSRTGWLFVALLVGWWVTMRRRVGLRLPPAAVVLGTGLFVTMTISRDTVSNALLLSASETLQHRLQVGSRGLHWATLWDAIGRSPWVGYGWQQVGLAQQAAALDHPAVGEWLLNSHNLVLDLLIWNGVPLGLLAIGGLVIWFVRRIRSCRTIQQWSVLGAVGVTFVHALLEYPLDYLYFLLPLGLMMGVLEGASMTSSMTWRIPRMVVGVILAGQLGLWGWVVQEYLVVQESARALRLRLARIVDLEHPEMPPPPPVVLLDALREFHRFWLTPARAGLPAAELEAIRHLAQRYPSPPALLRHALAEGLNGRPMQAQTALALICKLHPPERCIEGRTSWIQLQALHPVLAAVPLPPAPPETSTLQGRTRAP